MKALSDKLKNLYDLSPDGKRQGVVVDTKTCLNCLPLDHFLRDCKGPSKCRKCGSNSRHNIPATYQRSIFAQQISATDQCSP